MHADRRRCERIVRREDECSPILASVVRRIFRASDYVVPSTLLCQNQVVATARVGGDILEDVGLGRMGGDVWRRILRNGLELSR